MGDVLEAKAKLRELAEELDGRSRELAQTNRDLEPVLEQYEAFIRDFEVGLYDECQDSERRLPAKEMRVTLALREMPTEFRGKHHTLLGKRERLRQRISDLKAEVDAWRSVLSAERVEVEALG